MVWKEFNTSDDAIDAGLEPWEQRFYGKNLRLGDRVLLVGCGTGRDLIALRRLGHAVTGLDQSDTIIELARGNLARRGLTAELIAAPIETAELGGPYDAIIMSNLCYSCILETAARIAALKSIKSDLAPGGRVLMSYLFSSGRPARAWRLARVSALLSRNDWRPERGDLFLPHDRSRRLLWIPHSFEAGAVRRECGAAGLKLVNEGLEGEGMHCAVAMAV
jgi:SAM-dependent methyltransferase